MLASHPPYPPEFRQEAVRLVQTSEKSRREIADDLGISTRPWASGSSRPNSTPGSGTMA